MYGLTAIRAALKTDLEAIATPTRSFTIGDVDETGDEDMTILDTPAVQLVSVEGVAEIISATGRAGSERSAFEIDLFAKDGELDTLDKAITDLRNVIEIPTSTLRSSGVAKSAVVSSWGIVEGVEVQRSATHRARLVVEIERVYNRGDA